MGHMISANRVNDLGELLIRYRQIVDTISTSYERIAESGHVDECMARAARLTVRGTRRVASPRGAAINSAG